MELKNPQHMEELIKKSFEDFESDVRPDVWNNIQKGLSKTNPSSISGTGSFFSSLGGKFLLGSAAVTVIAISTYFALNTDSNSSMPDKNKIVSENNIPKIENTTPINNTASSDNNNNGNSSLNNNVVTTSPEKINFEPSTSLEKTKTQDGSDKKTILSDVPVNVNNGSQTTSGNIVSNLQSILTTDDSKKDEITAEDKAELIDLIYNKSIAKISVTPKGGYAPLSVTFNNQGSGEYNEWIFSDGSAASIENSPTHVFEKPGTYKITLKSTDSENKSGGDTITILVLNSSKIAFIPNNFTPNGDGTNDLFKVLGDEIVSIKVIVYDRSGDAVAKWESISDGWDGINMNNGELCPQGTYAYIVKCTGIDGKMYEYSGPITLKR